ncbi:tRNA (guanosine(46)-N7)-methyltransferase TrmB [Sapientia aquatica]|uniref:tRNA (guanine-N(7)-)-methyltransferase n=1 Tax=Sapientia aquatica TaxID=1549640 RepID=A0A4R5W5H1_9BURK|nr:tRNA (guanosine(46)-N7)-methyltransferase TrmB [Sapientia aquatica]
MSDKPTAPDDSINSEAESAASAKPMFYDPTEHRIRSFVTRAGRVSTGQAKALETLGPQFCVPYQKAPLDVDQTFGRNAPTVFEIGFGMGETSVTISAGMPDKNFIGVEVHTPGVGSLLKLIGEKNLTNQRIIQHDAFEVLTHMFAPNSLAGVHVFFPDPWHKARHNKRRLIQGPMVELITSRLAVGGYLHCATDWEDYAVQMLEVLGAEAGLQNTADGYAPRPAYRPVTKFENRGLKLGHGVWDLVFVKK